MIVRTKERELKHLIVDVVEHFAGQTVNRIIEIIEAGLKGKGDYDVKQAVADSLMDGTLELDENLHLRVSQSPVAISKATQKQVNEDRKSLEQESRDISPSEPQSGVLAKLRHIKDGYIEMKGRQVRLDPYSHRPAPSDRSQDASIYFALQRHHLRAYVEYFKKVGLDNAVHPYEWMVQGWVGNPLTNSNPRLIEMRSAQAQMYGVLPKDLFGGYWKDHEQ